MTNELNNDPIAYADIDARLNAIFDMLPTSISDLIDYLPDDFHAAPTDYLSAIPRLAHFDLDALLYFHSPQLSTDEYHALSDDARAAYIADLDATTAANFATLAITDTDLLALIAIELCDADRDDDSE